MEAAAAFGAILAENGIGLVFGGGRRHDGRRSPKPCSITAATVTGIIPEFLVAREHAMRGADNLVVTRDMHERKRKMFEMADAFVAMPGGIGTLEEIVEQITWVQLGRHRKPILLANIKNFWNPLCALIDHMKRLEFIRDDLNFDLLVADNVADILPMLQKAAAAVPESRKGNAGGDRRPALAICSDERHRLDAIAVRIANEGGVVALIVFGRSPGAPSDMPPPARAAA